MVSYILSHVSRASFQVSVRLGLMLDRGGYIHCCILWRTGLGVKCQGFVCLPILFDLFKGADCA